MSDKKLVTKLVDIRGSWKGVYRACLNTIGKETDREPSEEWKRRILLAEHSPIRKINVEVKWYNLKYWVSTHLVRHNIGCTPFVSTQRTDRTGINRDEKPQGALVDMEWDGNLQSMINISRKRLCHCASPETRYAWKQVVEEVAKELPEMKKVCVAECVYRGFCPEYQSCGYQRTKKYQEELFEYRKGINGYGTIEQIEKEITFLNNQLIKSLKD